MGYMRRKASVKNVKYVKEYYTGRYQPTGETRRPRRKPTKASVREANRKRALDHLTWELNENFDVDDWWATLTYRPPMSKTRSFDEIKADLKQFMRRMGRACKRAGVEFKCKYAIEVGPKGARHIHMVINRMDAALIRAAWTFGNVNLSAVYPQTDKGTYDEIAAYMIKDSDKTRKVLGNDRIPRYSGTRNLRKPQVETAPIVRGKLREDKPWCPKGYRVVQDSVTCYENEYGYTVLEYICLRC